MPDSQPVALFLFAHQDDEFGVYQVITDELRAGRRVFCAYLTSGVPEGQSPTRRNSESLAVLAKIGVQESDVLFAGHKLSIPDGGLPEHMKLASEWIGNWLAHNQHVMAICLPAWEGGHHDHDALHIIGVMEARNAGMIGLAKQFSLYNGYKCPGLLFRVLKPLASNGSSQMTKVPWINRLRFLCYCLSYPSQRKSWLGLYPFVFLHYVFHGTQVVQTVLVERIGQRPHSGRLYYEKRHFYTWEKMLNRIDEYENSVTK